MSGWLGSRNPFKRPMEESMENAVNISVYELEKYLAWKDNADPGFMAMYTDVKADIESLIEMNGQQEEKSTISGAQTDDLEALFTDMKPNLDEFDGLTRAIHAKGSLDYNSIWGANRYRFYKEGYQQRIAALTGLASNMTTFGVPLGAAAVTAYKEQLRLRRLAQHTAIGAGVDNSIAMKALVKILVKKFNKCRGWLNFHYAMADDCEAQVDSFFPLNLLRDHSNNGHYQLIVPSGDIRKVCIHLFKAGEMVELIIGDKDVWICTADDSHHPCTTGYLAIAGSHEIVDPTVFGDLTKKFVMGTNNNLTGSTDVIFNIIKP